MTEPISSVRRFAKEVLEDHASLRRNREKYHGEEVSVFRLPLDAIRKVGFQTLIGIRLMRVARDLGIPLAPQVASRMLRHLYAIEVHWDAEIAPGISVVHGNGVVISHRAKIGPGCIIFQNVTLGEGIDPVTRETGAPTLEADVHIGPGATLLGPITIGEGSKIMAGAVVAESVPPRSVVRPAPAQVEQRGGK